MTPEVPRGPRKRPVRRRPKSDRPSPIDVHVGGRVRLQRTLLGLSQEKLGEQIGLTFQQVQKYERGANRIGASRLWELSNVLEVPVEFFFSEIPPETVRAMSAITHRMEVGDRDLPPYEADPAAKRESMELVRAYYRITDPTVRKRLFDLTKALAAALVPPPASDDGSET
ncbi:MAG TPA: helix-turn-helix transcriptional regulator [Stellaceae bacterium]|jgi:transcriptional regulator with XRE-family HTH domain|nr:helix-turn-helix transcriptional regulator [Stellaceae bacterium]